MKITLSANTDWYLFNFRSSLINQLAQDGHEVILISPAGEYNARFKDMSVEWKEWQVGRQTTSPLSEIPSIWAIYQHYKALMPDIVHHHTLKGIIYGSIAARFAKVPHVVNSVAGRGLIYSQKSLKSYLLRFLVNILLFFSHRRNATHWIFENIQDQKSLTDFGIVPEDHTSLIESVGVDLERFTSTSEPPAPIKITYVGRMLWLKGVGAFAEAAEAIRKTHDAVFQLSGEPDPGNPDSIPLETIQGWQDEGYIKYLGWNPEIEKVYQQSHIIVFPTRYGEGVPTVVLEAAASGRPVVSSLHPGCQAVIQDGKNGFLVDPQDQKALQNAIIKLIEDDELRQAMGQKAQEMIVEPFSKQSINAQTMSVYQKLMDD